MKRLLYCIPIVTILSVTGFAWQPFTYNDIRIVPVKVDTIKNVVKAIDPVALQYTFKDFQQVIREIQAKYDSNFVQWGSGVTVKGSGGGNVYKDSLVVVLSVKYTDTLYTIISTPRASTTQSAFFDISYSSIPIFVATSLSDSSFVLMCYNYDGDNRINITWTTVGIRKR